MNPQGFARRMAAFGPFESAPHLAVAVSGGPDSMALALLAYQWARERGGTVTALTVDHGLRPASAEEARTVARWVSARGIAQHTLFWHGAKPSTGRMAAAREARYRLLADWCRDAGVLHLLVAHTADDVAETLLLRKKRKARDGLAGLPPARGLHGIRLLRPLLTTRKKTLVAFLNAEGQPWLDDLTNTDTTYERNRIRASLPETDIPPLLREAREHARARRHADTELARFLVHHATLSPLGYATLDLSAWRAAPESLAWRALRTCVETVGGSRPRGPELTHLCTRLRERNLVATLGGCLLQPSTRRQEPDTLYVLRELAATTDAQEFQDGMRWDDRFELRVSATRGEEKTPPFTVAACRSDTLSSADRKKIAGGRAAVINTLPALYNLEAMVGVPHIDPTLRDADMRVTATFCPAHPLTGAGFHDPAALAPEEGESFGE